MGVRLPVAFRPRKPLMGSYAASCRSPPGPTATVGRLSRQSVGSAGVHVDRVHVQLHVDRVQGLIMLHVPRLGRSDEEQQVKAISSSTTSTSNESRASTCGVDGAAESGMADCWCGNEPSTSGLACKHGGYGHGRWPRARARHAQ